MTIGPTSGGRPWNGRTVMITARRTEETMPPVNVARPPERAAPPSTAAVMLFRV